MASPTENAEVSFGAAEGNFGGAATRLQLGNDKNALFLIAAGLQQQAGGLKDLSVGVRATYILLAEVKRLLEQRT